ncbi:MAG: hypothetical protein GXP08_08660 [Gammaproteobacteria bacterium]|nr:hypothetical protein [Gammaproteobacteria bacterium]
MNYRISAWLARGGPRLGIFSADTGVIHQQWHLNKINNNSGLEKIGSPCCKRSGIQQLTWELFLVGCVQDISFLRDAHAKDSSNVCLYCSECIQDGHRGSQGNCPWDDGK